MGNARSEPAVNPEDLLRKFKECQRIVLAAGNSIVADLSPDTSESRQSPNSVEESQSQLLQKLTKCEGTLLNAAKNIVIVLSTDNNAHLTTGSDAISPPHDAQNQDSGNGSDGDATERREDEHRRKDPGQMSDEPANVAGNADDGCDDVDMERNNQSVSVEGKILRASKSPQHSDTVTSIHSNINNQSKTSAATSEIDGNEDEDSLLDNESLSGSVLDDNIDDLLEDYENRPKSRDHENPDKASSVETKSKDEELSSNSIMSKPTGLNDEKNIRRSIEEAQTVSKSSSSEPESDSESVDSNDTEPYSYDDILETIDDNEVQSDNNDNISLPLENPIDKIDTEMKTGREDTSPSRETKRIEESEAPGLDASNIEEPEAQGLDASNIEEPEALGLDTSNIEEPEAPGLDASNIEEPEAPGLDASNIEEPEAPGLDASNIEEPKAPGLDASNVEEPEMEGFYDDEEELSYQQFNRSMFGTKEHSASTPGSVFQPSKNVDDTKKRKIFRRRRKKRAILDEDSLVLTTIKAIDDENKRTERIEERRKEYGIKDLDDGDIHVRLATLTLDYDPVTKAPVITVDPGLLAVLMPHQVNGVMFMWEACFESVEQIKVNKLGTGCILAHCMGLGKTLQVVTLVHTLFYHAALTGVKRVLVVCPKSTALNWAAEFNHWLALTHRKCPIKIHEITLLNDMQSRVEVLSQWVQQGGVCVIGYAMFRQLVMPKKKKESKEPQEEYVLDPRVKAALLDAGPDLVVCDEGHGLKNDETGVAQALAQVRTRRRIMLTGTPLQNNLNEYYKMVNFVKPKLLGNKDEFYNRFEVPIYNGQFQDSVENEINEMKRQAHVLHKLLTPTIQRKHYLLLSKTRNLNSFLPKKVEFALYIKLTPLQRTLYQSFLNGFAANARKYRLLRDYQTFMRIYNHPLALKNYKLCKETSSEEKKKKQDQNDTEAQIPEIPLDWFEGDVQGTKLEDIELSHKVSLLFQILRHCETSGQKLLVFSQSLYALNVIEYFLKAQNEERIKSNSNFSGWTPNVDYFRLDGSAKAEAREQSCKIFNSSEPNARLFLISTRAGGLGINLKAATRVVLFDISWNPSHDVQSIFRVYRIGQTKPCFIYRFIAMGTIEHKIYNRQVTKLSVAKRVVDENQVQRHFSVEELTQLYQLEPQCAPKSPRYCDSDPVLDTLLKTNNSIIEYSLHDSLLEDMEEERLSETERVEAWNKYEEQQRGAVEPVEKHILDLQSEPSACKEKDSKIDEDASASGASNASAKIKKKQKRDSLPLDLSVRDLPAQTQPNGKDNSNQGASISGTDIASTSIKKKKKKELPPTNRFNHIKSHHFITDSLINQGASTSGMTKTEHLSKNPSNGDSTLQPVPIDTDGRINQGASTSGITKAANIKRKQKNNPPSSNPSNGDLKPKTVRKVKTNRINSGASVSGIIKAVAKIKGKQKNNPLSKNRPKGDITPKHVPKIKTNRINSGASTSETSNTPAKMKKELKEEIKLLLLKLMPNLTETKLKTLPPKVLKAGPKGLQILRTIVTLKLKSVQKKCDLTPNNQDWLIQNKADYLVGQRIFYMKTDDYFRKCRELRVLQQEYSKYFEKWYKTAFKSSSSLEF